METKEQAFIVKRNENPAFFHKRVSQRKCRDFIYSLEDQNGRILTRDKEVENEVVDPDK